MLAHIDVMLTRWARWSIRSESKSVGFPNKSPMFRDTPSSGVYGSSEPFSLNHCDFDDVTKAIEALPILLKHCVIEYYLRNGGADAVAGRLGIKRSVMFKYIHSAHEMIDAFLCINTV
ncbi:hypothetical protein AB6Q56_14515 [Dechloromonas sp. ARDL1]|uniref:hypothetical protein n=1 Tax=Dechloromonas sp. ARDL1 TaxID=3322121 RepID=UPI003DA737BF